MSKYPAIDKNTEMKALAMLVRGDTYQSIADEVGISVMSVKNIKDRNPDTLQIMKDKLVDARITSAAKILGKSHRLIESRLDKIEDDDDKRRELDLMFSNGEIEEKEWRQRKAILRDATIGELTSVSREMFNQSQTSESETGKLAGSQGANQYVLDIAEAIKSGDTIKLQQIIFNPKDIHETIGESEPGDQSDPA